jgi:hypothetical protein
MTVDIIERLMDFDNCGNTAADRVNLRECAAIEIHKLRMALQEASDDLVLQHKEKVDLYDRAVAAEIDRDTKQRTAQAPLVDWTLQHD